MIDDESETLRAMTTVITEFNSVVWSRKKDFGLSLKAPISGVEIPPDLSIIEHTLVKMHTIE